MQRRGGFQLSLNAIVLLVLGIAVVSFAIVIVPKQFDVAKQEFAYASEEINTQITEYLTRSGELLTVSQVEMRVSAGDPMELYFGIQNTDNVVRRYYIEFRCVNSIQNPSGCAASIVDTDSSWNWFSTWSHVDLDPLSSRAFITYLLASQGGDSYNGRLVIWKCIDPANTCPDNIADFSALPGDTTDNMESYAEKKIVVAVN